MNQQNTKLFFQKIKENRTICIFGHVRPDGDAYGSAMGLKLAIEFLFPDHTVYAVVDDVPVVPEELPVAKKPGTLPEEIVKDSLCITVDTSTIARICDPIALKGKYLIKVDHHPLVEHFGDLEFVDSTKVSCTLLLSEMIFSEYPIVSQAAAECLLLGLVTDSGSFRFATDASSYSMAGRLINNGANLKRIYRKLNTTSLDNLRFKGKLLGNIQTRGVLAYEVFKREELQEMGKSADSVAPQVNNIGNTKECPVWAFFAQYPDGSYRAELRCTSDYDVSPVAVALGGGGHEQASGAQLKDDSALERAIDLLSSLQPIGK